MSNNIKVLNDTDYYGSVKVVAGTGYFDLDGNEIRNAVVQNLAVEPTGVAGQMLYNTATGKWGYKNATGWFYPDMAKATYDADNDGVVDLSANSSKLNGQLASFYLNRANHTGTQLASTISDFNTQVRTNTLNQMAAPTANLSLGSFKITNLADPTASTDAATKNYVDNALAGLDPKPSVTLATTANITLSGGTQDIDGMGSGYLFNGHRILVKNQTNAVENGIYVVNTSGAWTRASDMPAGSDATSAYVFVERGTTQADTGWVCTNDGVAIGSTALTFTQFTGGQTTSAGAGLTKTGNTFSANVDNQSTEIVSNNIVAKLDTAGAIQKTASGMKVAIDSTLVISGNVLGLATTFQRRKFTGTITGDGTTTQFTVNHALATVDIDVTIIEVTTGSTVQAGIDRYDSNNVRVTFKVAPVNAKAYKVNIIG